LTIHYFSFGTKKTKIAIIHRVWSTSFLWFFCTIPYGYTKSSSYYRCFSWWGLYINKVQLLLKL